MKQIAIREELAFLSENPPQIIESFLSARDIRNSSKNTYRRQLMQFIYYLRENHITAPKRETILNFKAHLLKKELSPLTINSYLVALRNFFTYLESESLYPNIAKNINSCPTTSFFVKEPLTVNQIEELLKSIDTTSVCGKRDYAVLNLMIRAGLRSIEIVRY